MTRLLLVLLLVGGTACATPPASEVAQYHETFRSPPEGFPSGNVDGLHVDISDGIYKVAIEQSGAAHFFSPPVVLRETREVKVRARVTSAQEGPIYGIGCWGREDEAYLGLVQVENGRATGGLAQRHDEETQDALAPADPRRATSVNSTHTIELTCQKDDEEGLLTLKVDGALVAEAEVAPPIAPANRVAIYAHFGATPPGEEAVVHYEQIGASTTPDAKIAPSGRP